MYHILIAHILNPYIDSLLLNLLRSSNENLKYIYFNSYLLQFPLYTIISIFGASVSYHYIEKPLLLLRTKFFSLKTNPISK